MEMLFFRTLPILLAHYNIGHVLKWLSVTRQTTSITGGVTKWEGGAVGGGGRGGLCLYKTQTG